MPTGGNWKQLFKGAQEGDIELVSYYLQMDMNPNYQHPEVLTTPLIESASKGHLEIVKLLLEKGADPHIKASLEGWTALEAAQEKRQYEVAAFLSQHLGLEYQTPIFPKNNNSLRKQKALKATSFLNGFVFILGAYSFFIDGKILLSFIPLIAGLLNLYAGLQAKKQKPLSALILFGITFFNILVALVLAYDYFRQGSDYIHFAWLFVAIVSFLSFLYQWTKKLTHEFR